jgi:alpha-L-fucosidase
MHSTRRQAIGMLAALAPAVQLAQKLRADPAASEISAGPFQPTRESLAAYQIPDWFGKAKFGIWAHWGPQSAAEYGDWYARNIYIQGSKQNLYHVKNYGHPSKFGHKDIVPTWKAAKFDPDYLMGLYKKAGARYFFSMGVHHDNFDLWNSRHTRWNAVNMGPKIDVVGLWQKAARNHGLKFGVSDHLWISYKWFSVAHGSDKTGPLAGVPYDGIDPQWDDLYSPCKEIYVPKVPWNDDNIPESWKQMWFMRIKDLVDNYQPDVLYADGPLPFEDWGLKLLAHHYNLSAAANGGVPQVVYTSKRPEDEAICLFDVERGLVTGVWPKPWQSETCVGNWHYDKTAKYKTPKTVIDTMVDVVSRNGNFMLNFPLPNSGMLDDKELAILDGITKWMAVNSDAIHDTTPWKIYGQGPHGLSTTRTSAFNERNRRPLTAEDVRFTTKGDALFAFAMDWPQNGKAVFTPLALGGPQNVRQIQSVELLGSGPVQFTQDATALTVQMPAEKPCEFAVVCKVMGA